MPPTPAEERPPTDHDWSTTDLPATPQRDFLIPAERWVEAPPALLTLGADLGIDLVAYKRRIGRYLLWRAGPAVKANARYMAIAADDLDERWTFRLFADGSGEGTAPGGSHTRFRTWKEDLRDASLATAQPPEPEDRKEVANPFAAPGVGSLYHRGRPFHHPRSLARIRAIVGDAPIERGLDLACGTGMSTVALGAMADTVVGVDVSYEMVRAGRRAPNCSYVLAHAEILPFPDASFDCATCCSGVHWFDQVQFFAELRRVLRPGGWVALYDHYFMGEMIDVPEFADWTRIALERHPLPSRNPQVGDPQSVAPVGFEPLDDEFFVDDIALTQDEFVDYQLTISTFVAAAERGTPRAELREWLLESTAPLFAGAETRVIRFLGSITCSIRSPG